MCLSLSDEIAPPVRPEIFPASPKRSDSVKFVEFATQSASAAAAARRSLRSRNRRLQCAIRDPRFAHRTAELSPHFSFLPDKKTLQEPKGWENTFAGTFAICTRPETRRNIRKMCSRNLLIQLSECRKYNRDTSLLILVLTVS